MKTKNIELKEPMFCFWISVLHIIIIIDILSINGIEKWLILETSQAKMTVLNKCVLIMHETMKGP